MPRSGVSGSEVWNRDYMIAPVSKIGRVRLSTNFLSKKYGGGCRHERTMSFCSVLSFPASKHQERVFMNFFNGSLGHQEAWCTNSSWVASLYIVIRHLGKFSFNTPVLHRTWIFERPACSISYLFPLTVVLRLSSKIYATSTLCYYKSFNGHVWMLIKLFSTSL